MNKVYQSVQFNVSGKEFFQEMVGFGVNINSKPWNDGKIIPVMELLIDELGIREFRVDMYGRANWIDPDGTLGKAALDEKHLEKVYNEPWAKNGWAMMRYLNERGIEPHLVCTGIVPDWMCETDGKTLKDYESLAEAVVSITDWAKNKEKIKFHMLAPMNETDIGPPEGPLVSPEAYVEVCKIIDRKLTERGLDDIRLLVADQALLDPRYLSAFSKCPELADRVAYFGLHAYSDYTVEQYNELKPAIAGTPYANKLMLMTEYSDLDQTGEQEWPVTWKSANRLIDYLQGGFSGGYNWDAFDNYHEHDSSWTIYGLIRIGNHTATPKKRFYGAKNLYKYINPGIFRIGTQGCEETVRLVAFAPKDGSDLTIYGVNKSLDPAKVKISLKELPGVSHKPMHYFLTDEYNNCTMQPDIAHYNTNLGIKMPNDDFEVIVPARSIFTFTTL